MNLTRRTVLGGTAGLAALGAVPGGLGGRLPTLHVFDSRLGGKPRLAQAFHDIAGEDASLWRASRTLALAAGDHVSGVTRWSDWVALRGLFGERGLRVQSLVVEHSIAIWQMR